MNGSDGITDLPRTIQILTFELAGYQMAFNALDLIAVTRVPSITPVPRSAGFFEGLINLRGQLTPVINLRSMFLFPVMEPDRQTRLIGVRAERCTYCVQVDRVLKFLTVSMNRLETPPEILFDNYIENVHKSDDRLVYILNAAKLVDTEEIRALIASREKLHLIVPETKKDTGGREPDEKGSR